MPNTGDYLDGLKNPIRVWAVGNPENQYRTPRLENLHDKASGHGIVRFRHRDRSMTLECYRLLVDLARPSKEDQFPGWPRTISLFDNYGRKPAAHLPTLEIAGMADPVVQVIDEAREEIVYTVRIAGTRFRPMVFAPGRYTVKVGEPPRIKVLKGLAPAQENETLKVDLSP